MVDTCMCPHDMCLQKMATHGIRSYSKRDNCASCCQLTRAHRAQSYHAHRAHLAHPAQSYHAHRAHVDRCLLIASILTDLPNAHPFQMSQCHDCYKMLPFKKSIHPHPHILYIHHGHLCTIQNPHHHQFYIPVSKLWDRHNTHSFLEVWHVYI